MHIIDIDIESFGEIFAPAEPGDKYAAFTREMKIAALYSSAYDDTDDDSLCTYASPMFSHRANNMSLNRALLAVESAGLNHRVFRNRLGGEMIVITGFQKGRADRREKMSQVFIDHMNRSGYTFHMYRAFADIN